MRLVGGGGDLACLVLFYFHHLRRGTTMLDIPCFRPNQGAVTAAGLLAVGCCHCCWFASSGLLSLLLVC